MPISRSASMVPPLRRSSSASMTSLAQLDLRTLDSEIVLDYARKVMLLQPQPATSAEKLQMLFALSQKLMKWFLEDRERVQKQLTSCNPVHTNTTSGTESPKSPLHTEKTVPQCPNAQQSKEVDKPSIASRILASVVAPPDIKLDVTPTAPTQIKNTKVDAQNSPIRPAEIAIMPTHLSQKPEQNTLEQNDPASIPASTLAIPIPQQMTTHHPPTNNALEVYMQVQRSTILMQKYVRGFMARRRFFKALEELLRGTHGEYSSTGSRSMSST